MDHDVKDNYFYLLTVQTGMRRGAGTKSNVNFVLVGNEEDSGIRILSDGIKEVCLICIQYSFFFKDAIHSIISLFIQYFILFLFKHILAGLC